MFKVQYNQVRMELKKTQEDLLTLYDKNQDLERDASDLSKQRADSDPKKKYANYIEKRLKGSKDISKKLQDLRSKLLNIRIELKSNHFDKQFEDGSKIGTRVKKEDIQKRDALIRNLSSKSNDVIL